MEVEKETVALANKLISTTSEEEVLKILNEHDHQMRVIEARNERTRKNGKQLAKRYTYYFSV